jgi:hypothetical protein
VLVPGYCRFIAGLWSVLTMRRANIGFSKRGSIPRIACINKTTELGFDFSSLVSALQEYVDMHLAPVWGTRAKLVTTTDLRGNAWTMLFVDTADDVRQLREDIRKIIGKADLRQYEGFHLLKGRPVALVFVKTVLCGPSPLSTRDRISLAASHELAEMLVDPGNDLWCEGYKGKFYAYEVCDAVEAKYFRVKGLAMSNFVYPAFFQRFHKRNSVQFDHMKAVNKPFQILKDGYAPVKKAGKLMLSSSRKKAAELRKENRDLHRSGFRRLRR